MQEHNDHDPRQDQNEPAVHERFNHLGTQFESPEADLQLALLQAKIADPRRDPAAIDLIDVIKCELDDISEQKKYILHGKDKMDDAADEIRKVRKVILKAASYEFDDITQNEEKLVERYLARQIDRWEKRAEDPDATRPLREEAAANHTIFAQLRENIFKPKRHDDIEDEVRTGTQDLENFANEHIVIGETTIEKVAPLSPEYEFQPVLAKEALTRLGEEDELTIEDLHSFYNNVVTDMENQKDSFDEIHPHMRDAVNHALHLKASRASEPDIEAKRIYVTILPDTQVHEGFAPPQRKLPAGARQYVFTLAGDLEDPYDLSNNAKYIQDFATVLEDAKQGQETVTKLYHEDSELLEKLKEFDDEAYTELLSVTRVLDHMRNYLITHSDREDAYTESEEKNFRTLDKMSNVIMQKVGITEPDEDDPEGWQTY